MTSRVTLARGIEALESTPSKARPIKIVGGLNDDLINQQSRATVTSPSGHMTVHVRSPVESAASFLARMGKLPGTLTLGGLPPLPGTSIVSTEDPT
jgi:hypothetical protein